MSRLKTLALVGLLVCVPLVACGGPPPTAATNPTSAPVGAPTDGAGTAYPALPPAPTRDFGYPADGQPTEAISTQSPTQAQAPTEALPVATETAGLVIVVYKDFEIQPAETTVKVGTSVNFYIQDSVHQPYAGSAAPFIFEAPNNLAVGSTWPHTFDTPGTFTLLCGYHDNMSGTLIVTP
jgi:plastocyanin